MFTRRHFRIKVMHVLYAYQQGSFGSIESAEKELFKAIERVHQSYLYSLYMITKIADYVLVDAERTASKHLLTKLEKQVNTRFSDIPFITALKEHSNLFSLLRRQKLINRMDEELAGKLFKSFKQSEAYQNYIGNKNPDLNDDKYVLKYLSLDILLSDDDFSTHIEDIDYSWADDKEVVAVYLTKTIDRFSETEKDPVIYEYSKNWEDDKEFVKDLLKKALYEKEPNDKLLKQVSINWDLDRITILDNIIINMAICEMQYFPTIPLKVTINEYIEISKSYSTPKSKDFVNGILDKLMNELKQQDRINKTGRGLKES